MGFLTDAQTAAIKSIRARAWNQPFQIERYEIDDVEDMFDSLVTGAPVLQVMSGDWSWGHQLDRRGREGGVVEDAELLLACDIIHASLFMASGSYRQRLLVPDEAGIPTQCEILSVTEYPGSGEVVVAASRIRKG